MKRVAVVGCPGAGKTTFSRRLAQKTGLPLVHLDFYFHQKKHNYYNDKEAWVKRVKQLIKSDKWIIDGNYSSTFDVRFNRADTIIFLDYPRKVSFMRMLKRRIELSGKVREDMPSDWKEKVDWEFLKYVWRFQGDSRDRILTAINKLHNKQVIILNSPTETQKYIDNL